MSVVSKFPNPSLVRSGSDRIHISAALWGGPPHKSVRLCVGAAYELGRDLVDHAEAMLAGVGRPWDGDPGRVPFVSRSARSGAATPGAGAGARAASAGPRSGRSGAPRSRAVRPDAGVDSGA